MGTACRPSSEQQRTAEGSGPAAGSSVRLGPGTNPAASRPWQPTALNRTCPSGNRWPILRSAVSSMSGSVLKATLDDGDGQAGHGQHRDRDHAPCRGPLPLLWIGRSDPEAMCPVMALTCASGLWASWMCSGVVCSMNLLVAVFSRAANNLGLGFVHLRPAPSPTRQP